MQSKELALLTYRAAIDEIAEIQQRQTMREAVIGLFRERALPLRELSRHLP